MNRQRVDAPARWLAALRESVWAPVAAKGGAILAGMLVLGGIGAASTLAGAGVPVNARGPGAPSSSGAWLPPESAAAPASPSAAPATHVVGADAPAAAATPPAAGKPAGVTADGKVILNTASAEELTKLPRVGPKRAQAIIQLRQKLGRFRQPTDLLRVRGIGRKTLKLMLDKLVVDG